MDQLIQRLRRFAPNLRGTTRVSLPPDLFAGLTVAALAVPQGMAFALVAGVPIEMGLLAAALPTVVAALFGSSPFLVTGPTGPVALLLGASVVGPAVAAGAGVPVAAVLGIALLSGAMLVTFGLLGFGKASRFLSDSVIRGLITAVGLLVALRQVPAITGTAVESAHAGSLLPNVWPLLASTWHALGNADPRAVAVALSVPGIVIALRRLDPRLPGALLGLATAAAVSTLLGWNLGPDGLATLQDLPLHWSRPQLPPLPDIRALGAPALAIALLVTVQSTAAARALAMRRDAPFDPDRELVGQGAANLTAALVGAIPTSGSFTRTGLASRAGARTRLAAVVSGLSVFFLLPVLGLAVARVPLAALAGLVILSGLELVRIPAIRQAAATRGDAVVLLVTFGATLWLDVVQAVYAGLFLSLALLVRRSGRLQMMEIALAGQRRLREVALDGETGTRPVVVLHLEGDLNFAVAPELSDRLATIGARGARVLILRLKRARHLDATALEALRRVFLDLQEKGTVVILCGLTAEMARLLASTDLGRALGPEGLLQTGPRLSEGLERALDRARQILQPLPDDAIFRCESTDAWSYEI